MLTLEQIKQRLTYMRPSKVAEAIDVHFNTVREIRDNPDANPSYKVYKALSDFLEKNEADQTED